MAALVDIQGLAIAYYLRHCGNTHYFAALKPYLDHFLRQGKCANHIANHIVVSELTPGCERIAEYQGYRHLFTTRNDLNEYELVLTPTHLRDDEIAKPRRPVRPRPNRRS